ncbi:hypothetical protein BCR37DRAFT_352338 [Protomyces lactucae-debilis]|uniref:DUF1348-domain-containing protein n=1 Tax=Protomyces lactucae-debilis TaxID=2754530 RepID=A0A1Y2EUD1_PROLT|nr:uncharacterized protein BCR37DRAFT_352338 [Protomyces lactucae-debilis]ORY75149.1 hypothetical protein BCR37DRAFT_352338 [Protomyces lactucae-debilis]
MFNLKSAASKVKKAQSLWNTRDPGQVVKAYTLDSLWRNRDSFLQGHTAIEAYLAAKWAKEQDYILRKELFAFMDNRIAVQFWYEYRAKDEQTQAESQLHGHADWRRCHGLEHWQFAPDGRMETRMMSGNEIAITASQRWFKDSASVDQVQIPLGHGSSMLRGF